MQRILLFSLLAAGLAMAQAPERGRGGMMRISPVLAALDADKDGTISAPELQSAPVALKALDKDSDGQIAATELRPAGGGADRWKQLDTNGDGRLDKSEIPERMQPMIQRADSDGDGSLSEAELAKMAEMGPGRGGRGGAPRDAVASTIDTDGDQKLSAAEIAASAQSLAKLDKNSDGKLTGEELMPGFRGGRRGDRK